MTKPTTQLPSYTSTKLLVKNNTWPFPKGIHLYQWTKTCNSQLLHPTPNLHPQFHPRPSRTIHYNFWQLSACKFFLLLTWILTSSFHPWGYRKCDHPSSIWHCLRYLKTFNRHTLDSCYRQILFFIILSYTWQIFSPCTIMVSYCPLKISEFNIFPREGPTAQPELISHFPWYLLPYSNNTALD